MRKTKVTDISALKGMKLTKLILDGLDIKDISAVRGMQLKEFYVNASRISDISVLKGMPLKKLEIVGPKVKDISIVKGMPLEELLIGDSSITDISPLIGSKLKIITVPDNVKNIKILKGITTLVEINFDLEDFWDWYEQEEQERKDEIKRKRLLLIEMEKAITSEAILKKIIIPKMGFEEASLNTVCQFLFRRSKTLDMEKGVGCKFIVEDGLEKSVSIDVDNLPLYDFVYYIALIADVHLQISKKGVIFSKKSDKKKPFIFKVDAKAVATINKKLDGIIMKKVTFKNTALSDVLAWVKEKSRVLDFVDGTGINILLLVPKAAKTKISLDLKKVTLKAVLGKICEEAGLSYQIHNSAIGLEKMKTKK
ncbi:MAG: hypothetical protein HRT89_05925 [Lentisphaeria bacterium]|nr:hypothetical protein [Lentisphaeria bacterium]